MLATGGREEADSSLPDPTLPAALITLVLFVVAVVVALLFNWRGWTGKEFTPSKDTTANFALFAGFYVAAQVIERLMEFVTPALPFASPTTCSGGRSGTPTRGSRTTRLQSQPTSRPTGQSLSLGVAAILGVAASCALGLFFLKAIGMHASHTVDSIVTGITIAAGTKPLHDFTTSLQNKDNPKTPTKTT